MGCQRYDILLVDMLGQAKQEREWTEMQLLNSVAWLKRMNARGHDVLIRPNGQPCLTLWDRLTRVHVAKLELSGVPCSAKIQVEEDRFQIWMKLGPGPLSGKLRDGISKNLALPLPMDTRFGSLAGFVNHRSEEQQDRERFVLAHEPIKPEAEATATWVRMLNDTDKLLRVQGRQNSSSPLERLSR
jgi:hypothetical protein